MAARAESLISIPSKNHSYDSVTLGPPDRSIRNGLSELVSDGMSAALGIMATGLMAISKVVGRVIFVTDNSPQEDQTRIRVRAVIPDVKN